MEDLPVRTVVQFTQRTAQFSEDKILCILIMKCGILKTAEKLCGFCAGRGKKGM